MENKLTDNEIKKALECCTTNGASCKNCPAFVKVDRSNCKKYFRGALDYINRLEAEKETYKDCFEKCFKDLENAHTEAIKEFAKLLIDKSKNGVIHISDIPDYVKEISGEGEWMNAYTIRCSNC